MTVTLTQTDPTQLQRTGRERKDNSRGHYESFGFSLRNSLERNFGGMCRTLFVPSDRSDQHCSSVTQSVVSMHKISKGFVSFALALLHK
eukprot:5712061-Amphidinium_carterae.1